MIEKRVIDGSVLRLVGKWISVGVIEDGKLLASETGRCLSLKPIPWTECITLFPLPPVLGVAHVRVGTHRSS